MKDLLGNFNRIEEKRHVVKPKPHGNRRGDVAGKTKYVKGYLFNTKGGLTAQINKVYMSNTGLISDSVFDVLFIASGFISKDLSYSSLVTRVIRDHGIPAPGSIGFLGTNKTMMYRGDTTTYLKWKSTLAMSVVEKYPVKEEWLDLTQFTEWLDRNNALINDRKCFVLKPEWRKYGGFDVDSIVMR